MSNSVTAILPPGQGLSWVGGGDGVGEVDFCGAGGGVEGGVEEGGELLGVGREDGGGYD